MIERMVALAMLASLAACSGTPAPRDEPVQPAKGGCYQSQWQAETVPVINKRLGPAGLEKYDEEHQQRAQGCP